MTNNFTEIHKKYKGLWIALDKSLKKVIASGKSGEDVYRKALNKGYKKPTLFKVPQEICLTWVLIFNEAYALLFQVWRIL